MPVSFLSEAERSRLSHFPTVVSPTDLITFFTLSDSDLSQVRKQRGDHNRLGFALQLSGLRYLGFCPDDLSTAPAVVVNYLAEQLQVNPTVLNSYGQRAHTRTDHQKTIQVYLGFRNAEPTDIQTLVDFNLDGKILASGSDDKRIILWNLTLDLWNGNLDNLMVRGCNWIQNYLEKHKEDDRYLCERIGK